MSPFLYRCPNTGDNVQAWADDEPDDDDFTYVQVRCEEEHVLITAPIRTPVVVGPIERKRRQGFP